MAGTFIVPNLTLREDVLPEDEFKSYVHGWNGSISIARWHKLKKTIQYRAIIKSHLPFYVIYDIGRTLFLSV